MPYDYHSSIPSPQGLQLQTGAYRPHDIFSTQQARFPPPQLSFPYQLQDGVTFYEPFSERPSLPSTFSPPAPSPMHVGDRRVPPDLPWFSDRIQPSTDWLRPDDCVRDRSSGLAAEEPSVPPQKAVSSSPQGSQGILQGNEVLLSQLVMQSVLLTGDSSRSTSFLFCIPPLLHRTISSSRVSLNLRTSRLPYFFSRSSRSQTLASAPRSSMLFAPGDLR
jgi:hypothetical protein